ncbi:MAG: hypothetical protein KDA84_04415 [Planctomycetaceae bacterium]|nr:hypothetical protein [Planctomycetaceae bacterium]
MTTFSKILALITTAACFAFLGFVLVTLIAGPNWPGETNQFTDYTFEYTSGENPTWAVKNRETDQTVGGSSPVLPKKIVDVLNEIKQDQQKQIELLDNGNLQTQTPGIDGLEIYVNDPNNGLRAILYKDIAALERKDDQLQQELATIRTELEATTKEVTDTLASIESIFIKAERRRGDIYRLQNLVAESQTDEFRAIEHQKKLRDVWERYRGVIQRLEQRKTILEKQLKERESSNLNTETPQNVNGA